MTEFPVALQDLEDRIEGRDLGFIKVERILISCRHPVSSLLNLWIRPGEKIESSE